MVNKANENPVTTPTVRREGGSTNLTMGKNIPPDWKLVEMQKLSGDEKEVIIKITRVA